MVGGAVGDLAAYYENQELIDGVESNPGRYNLIIPSDYGVDILRRRELLEPIDVGELPNFDHVEDRFKRPVFDPGSIDEQTPGRRGEEKFTVPYAWGTTGLVYNKRLVKKPVIFWYPLKKLVKRETPTKNVPVRLDDGSVIEIRGTPGAPAVELGS